VPVVQVLLPVAGREKNTAAAGVPPGAEPEAAENFSAR